MPAALIHLTSPEFWDCYNSLPYHLQRLADKNFALLKSNPQHPSLRLKPVKQLFAVRVSQNHRALAKQQPDGNMVWFWIGEHDEYMRLING